ncbi:MAG: MoaD/ThiS family protein [Acidimicrobiia bacterium]|nr:MoaD/ThiS family protein [Acidimicrobiia bacterium]
MATVRLSKLLAPVVGDRLELEVEGGTVDQVIANLLEELPGLRQHLFDQSGGLRPHVLCFVDEELDRLDDRTSPVHKLEFLHAVSGG